MGAGAAGPLGLAGSGNAEKTTASLNTSGGPNVGRCQCLAWSNSVGLSGFFARIKNQKRSNIEYEDDLWSFFQNCWHLKDWIINDTDVPAKIRNRRKIERAVKRFPSLMISADLANRSKHSALNRIRKDAKIVSSEIRLKIGASTTAAESSAQISYKYKITTAKRTGKLGRKTHDALDVARQAVRDWRTFLNRKGLPY